MDCYRRPVARDNRIRRAARHRSFAASRTCGCQLYADSFDTADESPAPPPRTQPTISESERIAREEELEAWQQSADWHISVAFDADTPDEEILAVVEEYLRPPGPAVHPARPLNFGIYLNATNEAFPAYREYLLNHPTIYVCDDTEAFFVSILENPKAAGSNTLWAIDVSQIPGSHSGGELPDAGGRRSSARDDEDGGAPDIRTG